MEPLYPGVSRCVVNHFYKGIDIPNIKRNGENKLVLGN